MRVPIIMPNLGAGIYSGRIVKWVKRVGDSVERGDIVLEVESEKAMLDVEALDSGTLIEIAHDSEAEIAVGQPVGYLDRSEQ